MKRSILTIIAIAASLSQGNAQFFAKAGIGYAFPAAGQTMTTDGVPYNGTVESFSNTGGTNFKIKPASLASGVQGLIGLGYMLNKNIGVELGFNVGIANTKYTSNNIFPGGSASATIHANNPTVLTPSLLLQTDAGKLDIYMRSGIVVPVIANVTVNETVSDNHSSLVYKEYREYKYSTKFKPGFTGAIGAKYPLTDYLKLWVEASLLSMSLYAEEGEITRYEVNSRDYLSWLSPEERNIRFEKDGNTMEEAPTFSMPFSSIGINGGVSFHF